MYFEIVKKNYLCDYHPTSSEMHFTVLPLGYISLQKDPVAMKDALMYAGPLSPTTANIINQPPRGRQLYNSSCEDRQMTMQSAPRHIIC